MGMQLLIRTDPAKRVEMAKQFGNKVNFEISPDCDNDNEFQLTNVCSALLTVYL